MINRRPPLPQAGGGPGSQTPEAPKTGASRRGGGRAVEIAGNWASAESSAKAVGSSGREIGAGDPAASSYADIPRLDHTAGALLENPGETWSAAAGGACDPRWAEQLQKLKEAWGAREAGSLYLRFAHEMNGDWYPWRVAPEDAEHFKTAWRRFAKLRDTHFPGAKLVWCPNARGSYSCDIRALYPGDGFVDVIGSDRYNNYPRIGDPAAFEQEAGRTAHGGPLGLETCRRFAEERGKPFAVPEWSNDGDPAGADGQGGGDGAVYIRCFHEWLCLHGSRVPKPGRVLYEILFNVTGYAESRYSLFPVEKEPGNTEAARTYAELWKRRAKEEKAR